MGQEGNEDETCNDEVGLQKGTWLRFGLYSKNKRDTGRAYPNLRIMNQAVREARSSDPDTPSLPLLVTRH